MSGGRLERSWRVGGLVVSADVRLEDDRVVGVVETASGWSKVEAHVHRPASDAVILRVGGRRHRAVLARQGTTLWLAMDGQTYELRTEGRGRAESAAGPARMCTSPMTGVLLNVAVNAGDAVEEGQVLFVVEAMKMEYAVRAPRAATVADVRGRVGDRVKVDDPVVTFEVSA